jgi:hypothetical protein
MGYLMIGLVAAMQLSGSIMLDDVMTPQEQQKTGINRLTPAEKQELEKWLNENFTFKLPEAAAQPEPQKKELYLSENINNGKQLRLSDGSVYEIAPDDLVRTSFWITPFMIKIVPSQDPNYPYQIINTNTGTAVKAKQVSPPTKNLSQ